MRSSVSVFILRTCLLYKCVYSIRVRLAYLLFFFAFVCLFWLFFSFSPQFGNLQHVPQSTFRVLVNRDHALPLSLITGKKRLIAGQVLVYTVRRKKTFARAGECRGTGTPRDSNRQKTSANREASTSDDLHSTWRSTETRTKIAPVLQTRF